MGFHRINYLKVYDEMKKSCYNAIREEKRELNIEEEFI